MRTTLRKALLAVVVGVGMMGAVGAQTNESFTYYEVYRWNQYQGKQVYFKGGMDQVCKESAQSDDYLRDYSSMFRHIEIQENLYLGGAYTFNNPEGIATDIFCPIKITNTTIYSNETYVSTFDTHDPFLAIIREEVLPSDPCEGDSPPDWCPCEEGMERDFDTGRCVPEVDKCPEGTVNEGGVCVPEDKCPEGQTWDGEECLNECEIAQKQGVQPPQGCPECPEESPMERYVGLVACDLRGEIPCAWYASEEVIPDPDAREKYRQCTVRHEKRHIVNSNCFGSFCSVYGFNMGRKPEIYQDEMIAYKETFDCLLEKEGECTTEECNDGMEKLKNNALERITSFYNKYCNHKGTNCESKGFEFKCIDPDLKPVIN